MQDVKLKFSGLSCLIYCNNLANFYQILGWFMSRIGSLDMEWSSYEELVWKKALTICQDRLFASFLCVLPLSSDLGSFIQMYCGTGSPGRSTPAWGVKPLLFYHIPNIFAVNILLKTGEIHSHITFYKLFLSDIKVKILINFRHFLMAFLYVLSLGLTTSVFSKCASFSNIRSVVFEFMFLYQ